MTAPARWTPAEDAVIHDTAARGEQAVAAYHALTGRSLQAVYARARKLRVSFSGPPPNGAEWTPEADAELRRLAVSGLSARDAAKRMGISRGAAIGRSWRIGVSFGAPAPAPAPKDPAALAAEEEEPVPGEPRARRAGTCAWIEADPDEEGGPHWCGAPALFGMSWCAAHAARALLYPAQNSAGGRARPPEWWAARAAKLQAARADGQSATGGEVA